MRTPGRYRTLTEDENDLPREEPEEVRPLRQSTTLPRAPAPAPRPVGDLLLQLDPSLATRDSHIAALNELARSGQIEWRVWAARVREIHAAQAATPANDLAEARSTATEARNSSAQAETEQQRK